MGKMRFGKSLSSKPKEILPAQNLELISRIEALEKNEAPVTLVLPEPQILEQKIIEKHTIETVKEVSVITKDKRSRKHSKLVNEKLERMKIHAKALSEQHEEQDMQIRNLQELVYKLRSDLDKLDSREKALEAQIPEEIQEVKKESNTLLYLIIGASLVLNIVNLIL